MVKKMYYMLGLLVGFLVIGCNETLEETYDEYTKGGLIRYVGKCADVQVNSGWERLQVVWKNNIDAGVKRVKITWQSENENTPFVRYIDRSKVLDEENLMDTTYLEGLQDAVYTVRVSNVAADSSESLVEELYGRPYTYTHEDLRTFTRGIAAFGRMGGKLAVVLDQDNMNMEEAQLCYYELGKEEICVWDMKEHMTDSLVYDYYGVLDVKLGRDYIFLLPEDPNAQIDFSKPLSIKRKGVLEGCIDEIIFQDEELNLSERIWSTDFSQLMLSAYGSDWESKVNDLKVLELDYDMTSFQDLMYFPALEKVVLGKNRYIPSLFASVYASATDEYVGLVMLSFLKETRENFEVERYNQHYFGMYPSLYMPYLDIYKSVGKVSQNLLIKEMGSVNLESEPHYVPLDTTGWEVTCSDTTHNGYKESGAAMLLFDGPRLVDGVEKEVYFEPAQTIGASMVTVTFDMAPDKDDELKTVAGFKVGQPSRNELGDTEYLLSSLKIEFSTDGYNWTEATHTEGSATIGNCPGEETFISVPKELQTPVRFVRISMSNRNVGIASGQGLYTLRLGKFIPLEELTLPVE